MTTDEIIEALEITAKLLELHGENPFKVKAVSNAAFKLGKTHPDLQNKSLEELEKIDGIGKGVAHRIFELVQTGTTTELEELAKITPRGVIDMLRIKGLGPKKVGQLWRELGVESPGELLYACSENRLVDLKGFGEKTQQKIKKEIEFARSNEGKVHYASVERLVLEKEEELKKLFATTNVKATGAFYRKCEVIEEVEFIVGRENLKIPENLFLNWPIKASIILVKPEEFFYQVVMHSSTSDHLEKTGISLIGNKFSKSEEEVYHSVSLPYIIPELREGLTEVELAKTNQLPDLITMQDLKGILHNHSNYSDGLNSLEEMAKFTQGMGFEYFGICDHSQSAFYANGLKTDRVLQQWEEIDSLNKKLAPFKILKGIESDILSNGELDYPEEILKGFDFVVASVHSNLKMDEEKANARLIKAIENPFTTILGHPTGRLLLAREGYPINHKKIIDACAANGVCIELNAHPYRLDIDWRWIPYCIEKGVLISINPDAHEKSGLLDMHYGVNVARKGMLTKTSCLNAKSLKEIEAFFHKQ